MKRFDLSDKEFALIKNIASYKPARGPEPKQIREMLDGILFILCTGIAVIRALLPRRIAPSHRVFSPATGR